MRRLIVITSCVLALLGCGSDSDPVDIAPTPVVSPTSGVNVSDAVPSLEELQDMGLSESQAACFVNTIDPDGTGRVTSVDLFVQALGDCT